MSKVLKYIMIGLMGVTLANCSSSTYKIKQEKDKQVLKVPSWYMKDYNEAWRLILVFVSLVIFTYLINRCSITYKTSKEIRIEKLDSLKVK